MKFFEKNPQIHLRILIDHRSWPKLQNWTKKKPLSQQCKEQHNFEKKSCPTSKLQTTSKFLQKKPQIHLKSSIDHRSWSKLQNFPKKNGLSQDCMEKHNFYCGFWNLSLRKQRPLQILWGKIFFYQNLCSKSD